MKNNHSQAGILNIATAVFFTGLSLFLAFSNSAEALIASPARLEIESDPGEKVNSKLTLINDGETAKTFFFSAENFEAQEETGNPKFLSSIATGVISDFTPSTSPLSVPVKRLVLKFSSLV